MVLDRTVVMNIEWRDMTLQCSFGVCLETAETITYELVEEGIVCWIHTYRDLLLSLCFEYRGREKILNRWMD